MAPRTLHERRNSGITVRLDWDDEDNALHVTAEDRQNPQQSIHLRVEDPADAMIAFHRAWGAWLLARVLTLSASNRAAMKQIKERGQGGNGLAIAGLVIGILGAVITLIVIIAAAAASGAGTTTY